VSIGFEPRYIDARTNMIKAVGDIHELVDLLKTCDGVVWPKDVSFADLILKPISQ